MKPFQEENIFIFGMTAEEVGKVREEGHNPRAIIEHSRELSQALSAIASGVFSPDDPQRFRPIVESLYNTDFFLVTADFADYCRAQDAAMQLYRDPEEWTRKAILNTANMGWFSSDRTIRSYMEEIWQATSAL